MFKTFIFALLLTAINLCGYADFTVRVNFAPTDAPAVAPAAKIRRAMERTQASMQTKWKNTNTAGKHSGWSGTMPVR